MGKGRNDKYLSAYHIRRACDDSLRRLQTDHIDLYQMHHIDRNTPGKRFGKQWKCSFKKEKFPIVEAAILLDGR